MYTKVATCVCVRVCMCACNTFDSENMNFMSEQFTNSVMTTQINIYALFVNLQCEPTHFFFQIQYQHGLEQFNLKHSCKHVPICIQTQLLTYAQFLEGHNMCTPPFGTQFKEPTCVCTFHTYMPSLFDHFFWSNTTCVRQHFEHS